MSWMIDLGVNKKNKICDYTSFIILRFIVVIEFYKYDRLIAACRKIEPLILIQVNCIHPSSKIRNEN